MASVLDLVAWALAADVQPDSERKIGRWHIKLALVALATYADATTGETFVSAFTLAGDLGVSERDVRQCLDALAAQGLIVVEATRGRAPARRRLVVSAGIARKTAGMPADNEQTENRRDACGQDPVYPQGNPQGNPQASLHLSDPIKSSSRARAREARVPQWSSSPPGDEEQGHGLRETDATLNHQDPTMRTDARTEQLARVAGLLNLDDPGPIIDTWASRRAEPLRNPTAVLARMPDDEIRKELSRYKPQPGAQPPCPDCNGEGWIYTETDDGIDAVKCTHPRRAAA